MRSENYCTWSVCLSVYLLSHISPLERLFALKMLSRTQRVMEVKKFVGFSLKRLRCRDPALLNNSEVSEVAKDFARQCHPYIDITNSNS